MLKRVTAYFTKTEIILWTTSVAFIISSFFIFSSESLLTLSASLIGVTSLIFCAKGNPAGQVLMIIFSLIYTYISFSFSYYGEMITYCGMTLPMALFSLISWFRNPFDKKKSEVRVHKLNKRDIFLTCVLTVLVTIIFYFILKFLNTENLYVSTLSVLTSSSAAFLTFRRSPYFALMYALNDLVLIILWIYATQSNISYLSVVICFIVFFINDIYGFISWKRMEKRQSKKALP